MTSHPARKTHRLGRAEKNTKLRHHIVLYALHTQRRIGSKNIVVVSRKRAHKNGGKPIAKRIRRAGHGDLSADPAADFSPSPRYRKKNSISETTTGGCYGRRWLQ